MTPTLNATKTAPVARTAEAEQLLRDAAFVLKLTRRVKAEIIRDAARQFGWTLNVGWLAPESDDGSHVLVRVEPTSGGAHRAHAEFLGFDARFDLDPDAPVASLLEHFGGEPVSVGVSDRGDLTSLFTSALAGEVDDRYSYPSRV